MQAACEPRLRALLAKNMFSSGKNYPREDIKWVYLSYIMHHHDKITYSTGTRPVVFPSQPESMSMLCIIMIGLHTVQEQDLPFFHPCLDVFSLPTISMTFKTD